MPIRTTRVGSLPRADAIRRLLAADAPCDSTVSESAVATTAEEVVERQAAIGIEIANDGDRADWPTQST